VPEPKRSLLQLAVLEQLCLKRYLPVLVELSVLVGPFHIELPEISMLAVELSPEHLPGTAGIEPVLADMPVPPAEPGTVLGQDLT